ncbi:MAG: radical SAM protein [Treponema sp.]|nr:radical SAM protein [Treponema sp.]
MKDLYNPCFLCPRNCGVDRLAGQAGYCGETASLRIAVAVIHRGEEPPLIGTGGSGTIFISGCNLGCVFCQNYQVSQGIKGSPGLGKAVSADDFANICIALRDNGAENINIVTGSHAVAGIIEGLLAARKAGVELPVLWNSSGYDSQEALELLREHVDIFLPDLKTLDSRVSAKFFNAPDYPDAAKAAILKMIDIANGKSCENAREKVIIRHLILPGYLESTRAVLRWFAENIKDRALLSLMTQYTPIPDSSGKLKEKTAPKRYVKKEDYEIVMKWLEEFEIEDGFCQELITGSEWLPDFRRLNPFPSRLSVPVWSGV